MNTEPQTYMGWDPSLIERIQAAVNRYGERVPLEGEKAHKEYRTAMDLCQALGNDAKKLTELEENTELFILDWAMELPYQLARAGLVDEAITMGAQFAALTEAENFLPDRAIILAEAGRREDALAQLRENLLRFPEDPWVIIKSGDVYEHIGNLEQAERLYRQGLALAEDDDYTRAGALERLVPLLDNAGRKEDADALIHAEETREALRRKDRQRILEAKPENQPMPLLGHILNNPLAEEDKFDSFPLPHTRPAPKIGRNDPCPCGSRKKYKKCCLERNR